MIGKTISHYRIIDKIGEGGMGVVYRAEDTTLHRTVALKFLPPHLAGAADEMARFTLEARAAAALSHPNICTIYEIDEKADPPFISMEYIEGENLKGIVERGPLPLEDALRYASQVARALGEAHGKGVLHRDIKSANIVVSGKGHAIVMDFGLARMEGETRLTRTGTTVGTVSYMSPEQARGNEVDPRSDIWSLGVVLYRMVTGRYPFEGQHQSAVMYAIMNEPHAPLTAVRSGVPMELERIVDKALAKDPGERYQSVGDLLVDLKKVRGGLDGTTTGATRAAKPSRRPARGWILAAAVAVVAVAGFFAWRQLDAGDADGGAQRTGDGRVSIAVLPLDNMSPEGTEDYVADGMTEALIAELAQIHALRVTSRTSVMRFKGTTKSIAEVAQALGVSNIIEGSVLQSGGRVRVTAQLIDAATDEHLWAESYERDLSDVLALHSEVARAIANEVKVELTPDESARLASTKSIDPRAYDAYLRGRHHWNRRNKPALESALELFQQAIEIEPDWALAYSALSETYLVMASWAILSPAEAYPRGRDAANRALELDPEHGPAWACLGGVECEWLWEWDKADEYFRRALELEPSNATTHQWYGEYLTSQGRFEEALEHMRVAREIDPLALIIGAAQAWLRYAALDLDGAIAGSRQILELDPEFIAANSPLADACRYAGNDACAVDAYASFYGAVAPGADERIRSAYSSGGMNAVVRVIIEGSRAAGRAGYVSPANVGYLFASIGEADSAMVWLERAYERRAAPLHLVAVTPNCEPIHDDPRFVELLDRMHLTRVKPAYARR